VGQVEGAGVGHVVESIFGVDGGILQRDAQAQLVCMCICGMFTSAQQQKKQYDRRKKSCFFWVCVLFCVLACSLYFIPADWRTPTPT
jgi:hypothetical protein